MNTDTRVLFVQPERGAEYTKALADAIAHELAARLFNMDGRLFQLMDDGSLKLINRQLLRAIVAENFASVQLVRQDGKWETERCNVEVSEQALTDTLAELLLRVAKGPAQPRAISEQTRSHIRQRLAQGEPKDNIAHAYGLDLLTIEEVRRAVG